VQVGYGLTGHGSTGEAFIDENKRWGLNSIDATAEIMDATDAGWLENPAAQLVMDFDNGLAADDAFAVHFGLAPNLGFGDDEVIGGHGDSGGPIFIDDGTWKIAGVHSWLSSDVDFTAGAVSDFDNVDFNSTCGEMSGMSRVSEASTVDWILTFVPDAIAEDVDVVDDVVCTDDLTMGLLPDAEIIDELAEILSVELNTTGKFTDMGVVCEFEGRSWILGHFASDDGVVEVWMGPTPIPDSDLVPFDVKFATYFYLDPQHFDSLMATLSL